MINLDTVAEALSYLDGTIVGDYINGKTVFMADSKVDEIYSKIVYTNDCLKYVPGFEKLKFSMFMRTAYGKVNDMKFSMVFKVNGYKTQKCNVEVPQKGFEYLNEWFLHLLNDFIDCETTIDELNSIVKSCQLRNGAFCSAKYICDYTRKDSASLSSWDYKNVCFGLGMNIVLKLKYLSDNHYYINSTSEFYSGSIKEMVECFNSFKMHQKIGAALSGDVKSNLCKTYYTMNDAIRIIMKNKFRDDVQNITTCTFIDELGKYIVLCNWNVDYRRRKIDITVVDGKIYDIENDKFICKGDIYDRIDTRVQLPELRSPIIFGDMSIEDFINQ